MHNHRFKAEYIRIDAWRVYEYRFLPGAVRESEFGPLAGVNNQMSEGGVFQPTKRQTCPMSIFQQFMDSRGSRAKLLE